MEFRPRHQALDQATSARHKPWNIALLRDLNSTKSEHEDFAALQGLCMCNDTTIFQLLVQCVGPRDR